jgi:uncharacterized coiled-coil DUF342 family protein
MTVIQKSALIEDLRDYLLKIESALDQYDQIMQAESDHTKEELDRLEQDIEATAEQLQFKVSDLSA